MTDQPAGSVSQQSPRAPTQIRFDRTELGLILRVYGKMVALGECRDYAIGAFADHAVFCFHRRYSEAPTWTIEKRPELARRQGAYAVANATGQVLKRGQDLAQVLRVFDTKRFAVVS
ncbi:MAG: DUF2794 domain-containing protein [Alphaproteobacteria bacterium]|nr:DUF2794 domain-containing protein [Alphaproteobacteria bacterium]